MQRRFYSLVWPHRAAVLRVAQLLAGDTAEADDLAQETLIRALKKIDGFQARARIPGMAAGVPSEHAH